MPHLSFSITGRSALWFFSRNGNYLQLFQSESQISFEFSPKIKNFILNKNSVLCRHFNMFQLEVCFYSLITLLVCSCYFFLSKDPGIRKSYLKGMKLCLDYHNYKRYSRVRFEIHGNILSGSSYRSQFVNSVMPFFIELNRNASIDLLHKFHNEPIPYPTMYRFGTEMCSHGQISVIKWWIEGYLSLNCKICEMLQRYAGNLGTGLLFTFVKYVGCEISNKKVWHLVFPHS